MGGTDKGIVSLLIGGLLYAILRLGDEFVVVFGKISRGFDESLLLRLGINDVGRAVAELELTIETVVLGLLAIFFAVAIVDYVLTEK